MLYITGICKCLQNGCWVNEELYEVQGVNTGDSTVLSDAPRKSRENRNQQVQWDNLDSGQYSSVCY